MSITVTDHVFNLEAFLLGAATMLLCLLVQASFAHLVADRFKALIEARIARRHPFRAQLVFLLSALVLLASHLVQIYIWGMAIYLADITPNVHRAIVFAGSTYTTVGFTNDTAPFGWQLVTIIMAASGLFSFGWSTSVMFLLAQVLYPSER